MLEKGYTRIANELLESILIEKFTLVELKIIFSIIRKTYGFQKKVDRISLSQIEKMTGIAIPNLSASVIKLKKRNVLVTEGRKIGLNKNSDGWQNKKVIKSISYGINNKKVIKSITLGVIKSITTKETNIKKDKDTMSKKEFTADLKKMWMESFEFFWKSVWVKKGKSGAEKSWGKLLVKYKIKTIEDAKCLFNKIISGSEKYGKWLKNQFNSKPKWPQGWLTDSRWEDEVNLNKGENKNVGFNKGQSAIERLRESTIENIKKRREEDNN